ncbi:hypothetical protein DPEC_G00101690 [Dallia pectoralis]|uniref:Uncharacterized protein n=1 Tax=Dallia pectoralis TaxID=75939 RepID=A0ACC2GWR0_DALPE|nr:hypothetical protein DPEC_G00101690 [Dallia pectoralis]
MPLGSVSARHMSNERHPVLGAAHGCVAAMLIGRGSRPLLTHSEVQTVGGTEWGHTCPPPRRDTAFKVSQGSRRQVSCEIRRPFTGNFGRNLAS